MIYATHQTNIAPTKVLLSINNPLFGYTHNNINTSLANTKFDVHENEIVCLMGKNGSGKSTLLKLICRLLSQPVKDSILINGKSNYLPDVLCYMDQKSVLIPYLDLWNNILLGLKLRNQCNDRKIMEAKEVISKLEIDPFLQLYPTSLSGGTIQISTLLRSYLEDARIYLLDEPFNAIDDFRVRILQEYLWKKFKSQKVGVIHVSHNIMEAILISDRIIFMAHSTYQGNDDIDMSSFYNDWSTTPPSERIYKNYFPEIIKTCEHKLKENYAFGK